MSVTRALAPFSADALGPDVLAPDVAAPDALAPEALAPEALAFAIVRERPGDVVAREALLDRQMGPRRRAKTSERLRRGRLPAEGLAFVARDGAGAVIGTVRLWNIAAGRNADGSPVAALLLGPLAVDGAFEGCGIGSALMRHAIAEASQRGHGAILLVGDAPYYGRFGFSAERTGGLAMPGPVEPARFLALELVDGALAGAKGLLVATGRPARRLRTQGGESHPGRERLAA